jgi:hypothetical protein
MKLWEVMKALDENQNKVARAKLNGNGWDVEMRVEKGFSKYFMFNVFNGDRLIGQELAGGAFNGNVAIDLDWEIVKQPITWQEAIQAWGSGKSIRLKMLGWEQIFKPENAVELNHARITDGTWYVEE